MSLAGMLVMLGVVAIYVAATALQALDIGLFLPSARRQLAAFGRKGLALFVAGVVLIVVGISLSHHA